VIFGLKIYQNLATLVLKDWPPFSCLDLGPITIVSYGTSALKKIKAASSLVRFENKNIFFYNYYNAAVVDVNSKIEGLGPGTDVMILKIFSPKKLATVLPFFCCM
jgi:hypothetical protein